MFTDWTERFSLEQTWSTFKIFSIGTIFYLEMELLNVEPILGEQFSFGW